MPTRTTLMSFVLRALIAVESVLLVGYAAAGMFVRPAADDWCTALRVQQRGVVGATIDTYQHWSGRYAATLVSSFVMGTGQWLVRAMPGILLATLCMALVYFLRGWLTVRGSDGQGSILSVALGTVFTVALLSLAPHPYQSFYWDSGAVAYALPLVVIAAVAGLIARAQQRSRSVTRVAVIAAGSFVAAGFSETATIAMLTGCLAVLLLLRMSRLNASRELVTAVAASFGGLSLGALLMIVAPGNAIRASALHPQLPLARVVTTAILFAAGYPVVMIGSSVAACIGVAATAGGVMFAVATRSSSPCRVRRVHWEVAVLVLFVWLLATSLPAIFLTSALPPRRALLVNTVEVLVFIALAGAAMGWNLGVDHQPGPSRLTLAGGIGGLGIIVMAVVALQSTFGSFPAMAAYARGKDAQVSTMKSAAAKHGHEAIVPSLVTAKLGVLSHEAINDDGFGEIGPDASEFTNTCPGDLFGVMVRTAEAKTP